MASPTTNRITVGTAVLAIVFATHSVAEDTVNLGSRVVSKEEIVNILKPKHSSPKPFVARGLQLNPATEPETKKEEPRSLSLTINFEFDSAQLSADAIKQLTPLAEALVAKELKPAEFMLEGHTDAHGNADYNLKLSGQRAASVKAFLTQQSEVDLNRITAKGKGEMELADPTDPHAKANRRVVVIAE